MPCNAAWEYSASWVRMLPNETLNKIGENCRSADSRNFTINPQELPPQLHKPWLALYSCFLSLWLSSYMVCNIQMCIQTAEYLSPTSTDSIQQQQQLLLHFDIGSNLYMRCASTS